LSLDRNDQAMRTMHRRRNVGGLFRRDRHADPFAYVGAAGIAIEIEFPRIDFEADVTAFPAIAALAIHLELQRNILAMWQSLAIKYHGSGPLFFRRAVDKYRVAGLSSVGDGPFTG
jgi:hypothetical protein